MAAEPCLKSSGLGRKTGDINTRLNMEATFQVDVQAHMCEHDTNRSELRRISGADMSLCSQLRPLRVSSPLSCSANNLFCAELHSVEGVVTFSKVEPQPLPTFRSDNQRFLCISAARSRSGWGRYAGRKFASRLAASACRGGCSLAWNELSSVHWTCGCWPFSVEVSVPCRCEGRRGRGRKSHGVAFAKT